MIVIDDDALILRRVPPFVNADASMPPPREREREGKEADGMRKDERIVYYSSTNTQQLLAGSNCCVNGNEKRRKTLFPSLLVCEIRIIITSADFQLEKRLET